MTGGQMDDRRTDPVTICTGLGISIIATKGRLRGWRSIHITDHGGAHPYMDRWWVPGLQIGYEHSFVHQLADS
jgi:hypothetical protein